MERIYRNIFDLKYLINVGYEITFKNARFYNYNEVLKSFIDYPVKDDTIKDVNKLDKLIKEKYNREKILFKLN